MKLTDVLVEADDPAFLEDKMVPEQSLVNVGALDAASLHAKIKADYADYDTLPIDPDGKQFRMYRGRVTIWSGYPGQGKTTMLRQMVARLINQGRGVFVASFEEDPGETVYETACTAWGNADISVDQLQWFTDMHSERLKVWGGRLESTQNASVLAAIRVLAKRHGIRHAIIDSLMCLDVANGEYEDQRQFAKLLVATARSSGVHIHLVAHPRKPMQGQQRPDLNDVAGSADLGRLVDNVLFVRRGPTEFQDSVAGTSAEVVVTKQRRGGFCGNMEAVFYRERRQFDPLVGMPGPHIYMPPVALEHCLPAGLQRQIPDNTWHEVLDDAGKCSAPADQPIPGPRYEGDPGYAWDDL